MDAAKREGEAREDSDYSREMVLYIVHGLLHSAGEDDLSPAPRRRMRRREKEVLNELQPDFDFQAVFPPPESK
jgi:probable rRNA maturation factor